MFYDIIYIENGNNYAVHLLQEDYNTFVTFKNWMYSMQDYYLWNMTPDILCKVHLMPKSYKVLALADEAVCILKNLKITLENLLLTGRFLTMISHGGGVFY